MSGRVEGVGRGAVIGAVEGGVLVVGAGPTGLLLAVELARRGVRPRVIDAAPSPPWGESRALAVFPRTLEVLDRIGAAAPLVESGRRIAGIRIHGRRGRLLVRLDTGRLPGPFPFVLSVPQARTEEVLLERLAAEGVEVERPVRLEGLEADEGGVRVRLRSEGGDGGERATAEWVAGCDGAHSVVRERAGIGLRGVDLPTPFVFADCRMEADLADDHAHAFLAGDGVAAAIPLPRPGRWRVIASVAGARGHPGGIPLPFLEDLLRLRSGRSARLADASWSSGFLVRQRLATRYRRGRVVLAGDAAHHHSPVGGQGMNTGLRDAFALGWRLARVARGEAPAGLLDEYVRERRPVGRRVVRTTGWATRGVGLDGALATRLREWPLHLLARAPALRLLLLETMAGLREEVRTPEP